MDVIQILCVDSCQFAGLKVKFVFMIRNTFSEHINELLCEKFHLLVLS